MPEKGPDSSASDSKTRRFGDLWLEQIAKIDFSGQQVERDTRASIVRLDQAGANHQPTQAEKRAYTADGVRKMVAFVTNLRRRKLTVVD